MSLFGFDHAPKIFILAGPTDMRKGFDSLSGLVSNEMQMDPLSGYLFVFMNKHRNLIKILRWDSDGFSLLYKRL
jgi:transposase